MIRSFAIACAVLLAAGAVGCSDEANPASSGAIGGETGGDFHSLVADRAHPGRLYVGGHTRVSRSDDGGGSWAPISALDFADAMGWAITSRHVWVSGHPGLMVSDDGGVTFEPRSDALPDTDVHAFGGNDATLYAAGPGIGVAMSTDGAATWTILTTEIGQAFFGRILIDPDHPAVLFAADVQVGVVRSVDGGLNWLPLGTEPTAWISSDESFNIIYASGGDTPQLSRDGGASWEPMVVPEGVTLIEAGPDGVLYAGVHSGNAVTVWTSNDDGETWEHT